MPSRMVSVAAATAILGYDLLQNERDLQTAPYRRVLQSAALAGSAVIGDARIGLMVDGRLVARLYNTALAFPNADDLNPINEPIAPSSVLQAIVEDAPVTNALNLTLNLLR